MRNSEDLCMRFQLLLLFAAVSGTAFAAEPVADGRPFEGIRIQRWKRDAPPAVWAIATIDLKTPGIGFAVSSITYKPGPGKEMLQSADCETTFDFLRNRPAVGLAINGVAYYPFPAHNGTPRFLSEPVWSGDDRKRDPLPRTLMLGLKAGKAIIDDPDRVRQEQPEIAIGAFHDVGRIPEGVAVREGKVVIEGDEPHGRTAVGASRDGGTLFLLVADGYEPSRSLGLGLRETAERLLEAGALNAVFLDGGGSSTLVARDSDGSPVMLNRPAGLQQTPGTLRPISVSFGITGLRRTAEPLPIVADWAAPWWIYSWNSTVNWARVFPLRAAAWVLILIIALLWFFRRWRRRKWAVGRTAGG